jgi:hypothetical protein
MSDEDRVGFLREKIGYEAKKKGEPVHQNASNEFRRGYDRVSVGFGSNVTPRKFGRSSNARSDWTCVCGNVNKGWVRNLVANREVCGLCRQEREFVDVNLLGLEDEDGI